MTASEIIGIAASGVAAGLINAVAGGGTLITFPVLLLYGTSPIIANATSTLALLLGTSGSVYGYRAQFPAVRGWLLRFLPVSLAGGLLGSVLLLYFPESTFNRLIPFLMLFATLLFLTQGLLRRWILPHLGQREHTNPLYGALIFQFGISVYGGYFGAGIGILMLATMGMLGLSDIHQMNALKTFLGSLINLVAAAYFVQAGLVDWSKAGVLCLGAIAGYFLGSHYSQRLPQARVRQLIILIGLSISIVLFYKQFR